MLTKTHLVQDFTAIGNVGDVGQQMAGHDLDIIEPGTSAGEVMALYKMGADGGALTDDETGSHNLISGASTAMAGGIFGGATGAMELIDDTSYLASTTLLTVMPSTLTIDFWCYPTGSPANEYTAIYKSGVVGENIWVYRDHNTGKLYFSTTVSATTKVLTSISLLTINKWTHVTISWGSYGKKLWINGELESEDYTGTALITSGSYDAFKIGRWASSGKTWIGKISNVRVRNKVLTQKDVDVGYATTYPWTSDIALTDAKINALVREDGSSDFESQLAWDNLEVAKLNNKIYRYGGLTDRFGQPLSSTTSIKIEGSRR